MDRVHGATESAAYCRNIDFAPSATAFDAAFGDDKAGDAGRDRA